jgi:hypothetical protein
MTTQTDNLYENALKLFGPAALSDPLNRPQWIGVVISIISAVVDAISANNTSHWQANVSDNLDTIIWGEQQILNDLRQLRVDISEMFVANNFNTLMGDVAALRHMLITALASGNNFDTVTRDQIQKIQFIADNSEKDAYGLIGMGLGGYQSVAAGFGMLATVYRILKYNHNSFHKLCDDFTLYFNNCIDKSITGSFTERLAFAQFVLANYPSFLDRFESNCGGDKGGELLIS